MIARLLCLALLLAAPAADAAVWHVHRTNGAIVWAGQYAQPGYADEALDDQTSTELQAFLTPPPSPQQILAGKIAQGIALTSTGTPTLNGIYALDPDSTNQIFQIGLYASQFNAFPSGQSVQPYPDITSQPHNFTVASFVAFLRVVAPLVSQLNTQAAILGAGGQPSWPAQAGTIP